ncbi:hypothetical protein D9M72_360170 [compost metagenome]
MARVAHQRMAAQRIQPGCEGGRATLSVGQNSAFLIQAQDLQRDCRTDGVSRISGAVADGCRAGGAVGDAGIDLVGDHRRAHRDVAGGKPFGQRHDVRVDVFGFAGKHRAGAAEAGDDLVDDEEDVQLARGVAHGLEPALGRHDHAARALDRFAKERGHIVRAQLGHFCTQCRHRGGDDALRIGGIGSAVGIGRGDVVLRRQRQVKAAVERGQGSETRAGRRGTVITALQRDKVLLRRASGCVEVLRDESHGRIDRLGAAEREIHVIQRAGRDLHQLVGEADRRLAAEMKVAGGVGQAAHLLGSGLHHALLAVADVDAPQAGEGVEHFVAGGVGQPRAAARRQHGGAALLVRAPGRHRVDQVCAIGGIKRGELWQVGELGHGRVRSRPSFASNHAPALPAGLCMKLRAGGTWRGAALRGLNEVRCCYAGRCSRLFGSALSAAWHIFSLWPG